MVGRLCALSRSTDVNPVHKLSVQKHREKQVLFFYIILMDNDLGLAMCLGQSVEVLAQGAKGLPRHLSVLFEL